MGVRGLARHEQPAAHVWVLEHQLSRNRGRWVLFLPNGEEELELSIILLKEAAEVLLQAFIQPR